MQDEQQCHPSVPPTGEHRAVVGKRGEKTGTSSLEPGGWYCRTGSIRVAPPSPITKPTGETVRRAGSPNYVKGSNQQSEDDPNLLAKPSTSIAKPPSPPLPSSSPEDNTPPPQPALLQAFHSDPLGQILVPCRSLFACASTSDSL